VTIPQPPSLLAFFAVISQCQFISDLRYLDEDGRRFLSHAASCLPTESYSLAEWNDALNYLASMPPQKTVKLRNIY